VATSLASDQSDLSLERGQHTRDRLLTAAEWLFAQRGFEGTSTRAITQAAGTSLSAVNYHFGSKEGLLRATLLRHLEPVNQLRLERLAALETAASGAPLELEAILEAFLAPAVEVLASSDDAPARYRQVAARLYSDPPELVSSLKRELFGELVERYLDALACALPSKSREELALSWQFTVGVMVHVMSGHLEGAPELAAGPAAPPQAAVLRAMVAYAAAGLRAVVVPAREATLHVPVGDPS
jgi:AcrR family transcriptional regulator